VSLNWKEIDLVLEELRLPGSHIQRIVQPDFRHLVLELYRPGDRAVVLISLEQGKTRMHRISRRPKKPKKAQRFEQFLRSRIEGGRITAAYQIEGERIVKIVAERAGEETILWVRLWGGAANVIATDAEGRILDAIYRRPKRNEVSGEHYDPEEDIGRSQEDTEARRAQLERFTVREHPAEASFNAFLEEVYGRKEHDERRDRLAARVTKRLQTELSRTRRNIANLERKQEEAEDHERYRMLGDLIMSNLHRIDPGDKWVEVSDYFRDNRPTTIELDPELAPHANAERYYDRHKKAKQKLDNISEQLAQQRRRAGELEARIADLENTEDVSELERAAEDLAPQGRDEETKRPPGLQFESHGFRILVGRTARENDELLRRHVRGNDYWLHTRDSPGGYVFIRTRPGKSVPLDVLLDAGNLAIWYSKARQAGEADLFYTQVKHLRRAKHGKTGLVIPTQEKNLAVRLENERLDRLLGRDTADENQQGSGADGAG
jgi:predicted ribosome quality control (RQC) complex YloA/Tae2 family protein